MRLWGWNPLLQEVLQWLAVEMLWVSVWLGNHIFRRKLQGRTDSHYKCSLESPVYGLCKEAVVCSSRTLGTACLPCHETLWQQAGPLTPFDFWIWKSRHACKNHSSIKISFHDLKSGWTPLMHTPYSRARILGHICQLFITNNLPRICVPQCGYTVYLHCLLVKLWVRFLHWTLVKLGLIGPSFYLCIISWQY